MLMLTRKPGESIKIGDDIEVTVFQDQQGRMRLGIDAPHEVPIRRSELDARTDRPAMVEAFDYSYG